MTTRPAVLITGAAKRVGAELVRHFTRAGYDIALHYNASETDAKTLQQEIRALGGVCELFRQDLSDISAIPAFMKKVHSAMPHCTALINNASVFERASFLDTDEALFDRQFVTNFKAPFFLTQAFAKIFGKGCVVNLLDTDIAQTHGSHFAYLLSKKALAECTMMAARELGPNIRVNGVCPGIMLPSNDLDAEYSLKLREQLPLKALASTEACAEAASFLIEQRHITGQLIYIDGGKHVL